MSKDVNHDGDELQLEMLPCRSWSEGRALKSQDGSHLERWGTVTQALKVLGYKDRGTIYVMIKSGEILARKKRHTCRANSPYEVDLLSCWRYRQEGLTAALDASWS